MSKLKPQTDSYRPYLVFLLLLSFCLGLASRAPMPGLLSPAFPGFPEPFPVSPSPQDAPDFASVTDIDQRKQQFFDYLQPHIDRLNNNILDIRAQLEPMLSKVRSGRSLSAPERSFVTAVSREYRVQPQRQFSENHLRVLLRRVDVLPSSLVLAQAANESAWGTSRFAVEGNNYFGQWCFTEGCGLVPDRRLSEASHEVKAFTSAGESVEAYFMNINTFGAYQGLRLMREELRRSGQPIDGVTLAEGLESYSERGEEYIEELQSMIQFNDLLERDSV